MKFLVITLDKKLFYTNWFLEENYEDGMIVVNLDSGLYYDGDKWLEITEDEL